MTYLPTEYWTTGNRDDVIYGVGLLVFMVIEKKYNPLKKLKSSVGDFFGRPYQRIWALSLPFVIWFWLSLIFFVKYDTNLLLLRVFNIGVSLGTGHWFFWLMAAALVTVYGWDNIVSGIMVVGLLSALHEPIWYLFYYLVYPAETAQAFLFYLPFVFLCGAMLIAYFVLSHNGSIVKIPTSTLLQVFLIMVVFHALWALAGFPVSIDLITGGTQYYLSLSIALIENLSWVIPGLVLLVAGILPKIRLNKRTVALK